MLALQLPDLLVVGADRAGLAGLGLAVVVGSLGTRDALVLHHHLAVVAGELLVDGDAGLVQEDVGQRVVDVQLVLLEDDLLDEALDALAGAGLVGDQVGVLGGDAHLDRVRLVLAAVAADLPADALGLVAVVAVAAAAAGGPPVAVDVDAQVLAVLLGELVAGAEAPLLVELLQGGDDALLEDALAGVVAEHVGDVVQLDLEDLLGGLGLGTGGVDEGSARVVCE